VSHFLLLNQLIVVHIFRLLRILSLAEKREKLDVKKFSKKGKPKKEAFIFGILTSSDFLVFESVSMIKIEFKQKNIYEGKKKRKSIINFFEAHNINIP